MLVVCDFLYPRGHAARGRLNGNSSLFTNPYKVEHSVHIHSTARSRWP